jgi:hypothetical protein
LLLNQTDLAIVVLDIYELGDVLDELEVGMLPSKLVDISGETKAYYDRFVVGEYFAKHLVKEF